MAKKMENDVCAIRQGSKGDFFVGKLDDVRTGEELPDDVEQTFESVDDAMYEMSRIPRARS